jgi:hypothetical protein
MGMATEPGLAELGAQAAARRTAYGEDALIVCDRLVRIYTADGVEVQALQGLDLIGVWPDSRAQDAEASNPDDGSTRERKGRGAVWTEERGSEATERRGKTVPMKGEWGGGRGPGGEREDRETAP